MKVFRFLKAMNEQRNPVPREISSDSKALYLDEWPVHPYIEVRRGDRTEDDDESGEAAPEPLIRIRRANVTPCPKPHEVLDGWLKPCSVVSGYGWCYVQS
jgi:hypothetical protein